MISRAESEDGPRGRSGPLRLVALGLGAAALAVAIVGLLIGHARDADPGPPRTAGPTPVAVMIDTHDPGRPVPGRFLGLSFEVAALPEIAAYADSGNFVRLLRSLGPGVLRFGGVSADTQVAWTDRVTPAPAWASRVLDARDLRRLGRLASRSGWRVLLTVGLVHYQPAAAAREVAAAKAALGRRLAGVEIGNEPDAYAQHHFRPLPWTSAQYNAEVSAYRRAIARTAPGVRIAGPGVSGSQIFTSWGPGEVVAQRPALLTGHHYPLGCHQVPPPTIERLLSVEIRKLEGQSLHRFMSVARSSAIPFRLDEVNSVSCGGTAGISNAFASALWATGYMVQTMAEGASGINFEGNPANCRGYSPVCAGTPGRLAAGVLHAQPEWYALLLARALIGTRPLPTALRLPGSPNVVAQAFMAHSRRLRLVIVDDETPGTPPAQLSVRVGRGYGAASVLALTAPSPASSTGVRLGGQAVALDGSWRVPRGLAEIAQHRGVISLSVAPSSAELVTVPPVGARSGP